MVDDEADQLKLSVMSLEAIDPGLSVVPVSSPVEALDLLRGEVFDCVVSDYVMPEMDGVEFCGEAKQIGDVSFILYTGRGSEEVAEKAFRAGVDDYVRKEKQFAHYQVLANRVRHTVERHRAEEKLLATNSELSAANARLASSLMEVSAMEEELRVANEDLREHTDALRESQELMSRSQELAHLGSWELDLVNNKLSWSDEVYRIFGLKPGEFGATYEAFLEAVHPDDRERVDGAYSGSLQAGSDGYEIDHRVVQRSTGEVRYVHEKCEHIRDESGRVVRSIGFVQNMTERRLIEDKLLSSLEQLRQSEEELSAVNEELHASNEGLAAMNEEMRVTEEELRRSREYLKVRVRERTEELSKTNDRLLAVIEERKRVEQSLRLEEARLDALLRLSRMGEASLEEITGYTLEQAITLTGSRIGFVGFLNEDESVYTLHAVSKDVVKECGVTGDPLQWHIAEAGIWADAIRQRRTLFVNDYSKPYPSKKGLPPGHPYVNKFMVVPILVGGRIVALAGVGNKISDYDPSDERQVTLLLDGMWGYLERNLATERLQQAHDELEERVKQRTAELRSSNEQLVELNRELRGSEERLSTLYRSMVEGLAQHDLVYEDGEAVDYVIRDVNPAFESITGIGRDYAVGRRASVVYSKVEPPYIEIYSRVTEKGEAETFEAYFPPIGKHINITAFSTGPGKFATVFQDVTERKRLEEANRRQLEELAAVNEELKSSQEELQEYSLSLETQISERTAELRETNEKLQGFMESATEGFAIYDKDLCLIEANRVVVERFPKGTGKEDVIGRNIVELYPGIEGSEWYNAYRRVLETGEPYHVAGRRGVAHHSDVVFDASAFKVGDGLGVISRDVTRVREAERRLHESEEMLKSFMNSSTEAFFIYDRDLRLVDLNPSALSLYAEGTRREDLLGRDIVEVAPGIEKTPMYEEYKKVLSTGVPYRVDEVPVIQSLGNRWVSINAFKMGDNLGIMRRDVTERVRLEEKLRETQRLEAIDKISAMVAHDVRSPLTTAAQALYMAKIRPDRAEEMMSMAERNIDRAIEMIEELRENTRLIEPRRSSVDLGALIEDTIREKPLREDVRVETSIGKSLKKVNIDPGLMRRVVENLLSNAAEAMPGGGVMRVDARREGGAVVLNVSDTGVGISEEVGDNVFSPLYTTKPRGVGLGLPFCKRAVEAHGGSIGFNSDPGQGTTFTVKIPLKHV